MHSRFVGHDSISNAHEDRILKPAVIVNPDKKSDLMQEEIFGPILLYLECHMKSTSLYLLALI